MVVKLLRLCFYVFFWGFFAPGVVLALLGMAVYAWTY